MSKFRSVAFRPGRVGAWFVLLGSVASATPSAEAQAPPQVERPSDAPTPIASTRRGEIVGAADRARPNEVKAVPRLEGTPSPGLRVALEGSESTGGRMWYRWLQTQGPKVTLEDANRPQARFVVPTEATSLGFVLVVGNATGVDARALMVEVEDPERDADNQALKADAGDDQPAKVGRKVILNGIRSEPKGKIRFRWVQTGGPKVTLKLNEGPTATFLPTVAGTYQFALVVASSSGVLSEPSSLIVTVGGSARPAEVEDAMAIDELARVSLASIDGGLRYADEISRAFDAVADNLPATRTFAEAINETTRRLDAIIPREKDRRSVWVEQLFSPLMAKLVSGMKADGIDLTQPANQAKALTRDQKAHLSEQFRFAAAGLRASRTMR